MYVKNIGRDTVLSSDPTFFFHFMIMAYLFGTLVIYATLVIYGLYILVCVIS